MTRTLRWSIIALFATFLILFINLSTGTTKAAADIDWIDVAGEGGTSILMAVWWWVLLAARPAGKVSNFIISGIFLLFLGSLQDTLDEFVNTLAYGFSLPDAESIMMPLGMFLLTLGLLFWKEEQKVIDNLLLSREGYFRDHRTVDSLTHLADIRYLKNNITMAFERSKNSQQPLTLLLIDLDDFHSINRRFGFKEGDRLLKKMAELLILTVRQQDLACRFAGDRFAILLENTEQNTASLLLSDTLNSINHFKYYTQNGERVEVRASGGMASAKSSAENTLFEEAKLSLFRAKERRNKTTFVAI